MKHWLFPANVKYYDVLGAFSKAQIYWPASSTVATGDVVFIYLAAPYKQVGFISKVKETGLTLEDSLPHIHQFFRETINQKKSPKTFMKLHRTRTIPIADDTPFSLHQLKEHGLAGMLMGPRKLENSPQLLEYLNKVTHDEL